MRKRIGLLSILAMVLLMGITALAENDYSIGNIIATETDKNEKATSLIENVHVEYSDISLLNEESTDNVVTVTFDLTNTTSRAIEFNVYAAAYKDDGRIFSVDGEDIILQSEEKKQMMFTIPVPNDGTDTNGKIFVWNKDMQPTTEAAPFVVKNKPDKFSDATITEDTILYADTYYNNLTLNGGTIDLNGHKLFVNGELLQTFGAMFINNGELVVNGDYRIQTKGTQTDQYGTTSVVYSWSDGILNMTNENDRVLVKGDFYTQSNRPHTSYLTNGVLELRGNFTQISGNSNGNLYNFDASKNHKVVFSGAEHQTVNFESKYGQFNTLILTKPYETGYTFNRVPCWNTLYQADAVSINYGGQSGAYAPTGNYSQEFTDMTVLSSAGDMAIKRTYNSQDEESSVFNQGWTLSICAKLTDEGNGYKKIKLPDGSTCTFLEKDGVFEAQDSRNTLTKSEDGLYKLKSKSMVEYCFSSDGKIQSMTDRYGNVTSFKTDTSGNVTEMVEPSGKKYVFSYSNGKLILIHDEKSGTTVSYEYTNGRLSKVISPSGVCIYCVYIMNTIATAC